MQFVSKQILYQTFHKQLLKSYREKNTVYYDINISPKWQAFVVFCNWIFNLKQDTFNNNLS